MLSACCSSRSVSVTTEMLAGVRLNAVRERVAVTMTVSSVRSARVVSVGA